MEVVELFPTCLTKTLYSEHKKFKEVFYNNFHNYVPKSGFPLGEESGYVNIHNDVDIAFFFKFVSEQIREYLRVLGVNNSVWDVNLVKTWLNSYESGTIPVHNHKDAHLTWVYYINIPEGKSYPLSIHSNNTANDLTDGLFEFDTVHNIFSAGTVEYIPVEGTLLIFPSTLEHGVSSFEKTPEVYSNNPSLHMSKRASMAGDVVLTFKETSKRSRGLQPVRNWKTF